MGDIADHGQRLALCERAVLPQGKRVKQRLGRVLPAPAAGVDHRMGEVRRKHPRRVGGRVADDYDVVVHRRQRLRRVDEALALLRARALCTDVDRVTAEHLARQLEGHAGARGCLVEQHDCAGAAEGGVLEPALLDPGQELRRRIQQRVDLPVTEVRDGEQGAVFH